MKRLATLGLLCALTACGGGSPAPDLYGLQATDPGVESCARPTSIKLYEPVAGAGLDSPRISVLDAGGKQTFYQGVRWNAPTSRLVQLYLADTFERSGMFSSVLTDDSSSRATWLLETQLRAFHVDQSQGAPRIVIRLSASLVNAATRTPGRTIALRAERDVTGMNMAGIARGFDEEMAALSTDLLAKLRPRIGCH